MVYSRGCSSLSIPRVIESRDLPSSLCWQAFPPANSMIVGYACLIDRSQKKNLLIKNKKIISQIKLNFPTYKKNNLPAPLNKIPISKPGSRFLK